MKHHVIYNRDLYNNRGNTNSFNFQFLELNERVSVCIPVNVKTLILCTERPNWH